MNAKPVVYILDGLTTSPKCQTNVLVSLSNLTFWFENDLVCASNQSLLG
jgi:hypothetical protein